MHIGEFPDGKAGSMDRFNALGRGSQLMLVGSVLLLIVSFFRWQEVSVDLGPLGETSGGVSAWDDLGGILMGVLTIVLIARIAAKLAAVEIPLPVSYALTTAVLAAAILILAVLKNLTDDFSTFWSYLGVALAVVIAIGAWLEVKGAGGVEQLRSEVAAVSAGGVAAAEAAPPPSEAPAAEPSPAETPTAEAGEAAPDEGAGGAASGAPEEGERS
ncbi:MAG: hypothetical protein RMM28_07870 [Thermoleophilia bacterium]|nr:hypothetical protein [Thermoleophilia bacterium]